MIYKIFSAICAGKRGLERLRDFFKNNFAAYANSHAWGISLILDK